MLFCMHARTRIMEKLIIYIFFKYNWNPSPSNSPNLGYLGNLKMSKISLPIPLPLQLPIQTHSRAGATIFFFDKELEQPYRQWECGKQTQVQKTSQSWIPTGIFILFMIKKRHLYSKIAKFCRQHSQNPSI